MKRLKTQIKERSRYILSLGIIVILLIVPLFFMKPEQTGLSVFHSAFDEGTHVNTVYSSGYVGLDNSSTGTYTSKIFEAEGNARWDNISWAAQAGEYPSGAIEISDEAEFDGADDYALTANPPYASDESGSVSLWFNYQDGDKSTLFYTGKSGTSKNYLKFGISQNGKLIGEAKADERILKFTGKHALDAGEWQHLIFESDATGNKIYVNAEEYEVNYNDGDSSTHAWFGSLSNVNATVLGAFAKKEYDEYFKGTIDDAAVWSRALTTDEIQNLYKRRVLHLTLSARSCDNPTCEGTEWTEITGESPQQLSVGNNGYFQYRFDLSTDDLPYTPELYEVAISSTLIEEPIQQGTATGNVVTGLDEFAITVDGNESAGNFTGKKELTFYENSTPLMAFSHNFSIADLNLSGITINKSQDYVLFKTEQLQEAKTIYLEDNDFDKLCLKDAEMESIDEMSATCTEADETDLTACIGNADGLAINGYYCKQGGTVIEVRNVTHSALKGTREEPAPSTEDTPATTGGGGGRSARLDEGNTLARPATEEKQETNQPAKEEEPTVEEEKELHEKIEAQPQQTLLEATSEKAKPRAVSSSIVATAAFLLVASVSGALLFRRHRI